jgi:hypothetical protein
VSGDTNRSLISSALHDEDTKSCAGDVKDFALTFFSLSLESSLYCSSVGAADRLNSVPGHAVRFGGNKTCPPAKARRWDESSVVSPTFQRSDPVSIEFWVFCCRWSYVGEVGVFDVSITLVVVSVQPFSVFKEKNGTGFLTLT